MAFPLQAAVVARDVQPFDEDDVPSGADPGEVLLLLLEEDETEALRVRSLVHHCQAGVVASTLGQRGRLEVGYDSKDVDSLVAFL